MDEAVLIDGRVRVRCEYTDLVPTERLREHPGNPNQHGKDQIKRLAHIIAETGWRRPVVVSTLSGLIVAGHGRLAAARLLNLPQVPVDYQDYDSPEQELADLLADNRIAELADLYLPDVTDIFAALDTGAFDMSLTGYSDKEIEALMAPPSDGMSSGEEDGAGDEDPPTSAWNDAIEAAAVLCECNQDAVATELAMLIRERLSKNET